MQRDRWHWLMTLALLTAAAASWAAAPETTSEVPRAASARKDGNLIRVNGRPTVLTWAYGLTEAADLEAYAGAGLNTLALTVTSVAEEPLARVFELASAAEAQGLLLVGVLAPDALTGPSGEALAVDARSSDYAAAVGSFVHAAVGGLGGHPRLIAWLAAGLLPDQVVVDDAGFQSFLRATYPSLAALNRSWRSSFSDFAQISLAGASDIDGGRPAGVGHARIDLADYRRRAYAEAMAVWSSALRRESPERLALAGGLTDYRSLISVGPDFDGLVAGTTPATAEADLQTSNVQGVDIARRANQFVAIQTLDLSSGPSPGQLGNWISFALLHGASGIAIGNWSALRSSDSLRAQVEQFATGMRETNWFPATPAPRAAILYEPYAGGAARFGKSLYGYIDGLTEGAPTLLFDSLRNGSRYGLVDVLSLDSLHSADLRQYRTLIAPEAFSLPEDAQLALNQFVLQGGALVVDLGAGFYQTEGDVNSLPEILRDTLGLRYAGVAESGNPGQPGVAHPNVPGGSGAAPVAPGPGGEGIDPQVAALAEWVQQMLRGPEADRFLGTRFAGPGAPALQIQGLGKGFAVYAPFFLYQEWDAGSDVYVQFHDRVLSWANDLQVSQPEALWPPVAVCAYADKSVGLASPSNSAAVVLASFAPSQVYLIPHGAEHLPNAGDDDRVELLFPGQTLSLARPLPIYVTPTQSGDVATVAVGQYTAERLELFVYGSGAVARPSASGIVVSGGAATPMTIEIRSGDFPITPGASYRVTVEESGRRMGDQAILPNRETGAITLQGRYQRAHITVEAPAAAAEGE